jgi:putative ABC transport system substrate-binding protein
MAREHFDGFIVFAAPIMLRNSRQIVDLAARYRLPGVYARDNYVVIGGLLSYAPDRVAMFRTWAEQVHRVLKGAKPGDLPIQQPRKFIVTINLKKSKALGLTVPRSILLLADKVIE